MANTKALLVASDPKQDECVGCEKTLMTFDVKIDGKWMTGRMCKDCMTDKAIRRSKNGKQKTVSPEK